MLVVCYSPQHTALRYVDGDGFPLQKKLLLVDL